MKKFSKIVLVVLVAAMLCVSFAGCGSSTTQSTGDADYKIATDTTFAPFEFEDKDGNFVGIDMDILAAIAEDQGFTYDLQVVGFQAALTSVQSGQADGMIAGMSITDERKETFDFSDQYYESGLIFAVSATNDDIKTMDDLKGKKIAVKNGTQGAATAEKLKDQYGFTITTFEDSANLYEEVKAGNSDALIEDSAVVAYAMVSGEQPIKMVGEVVDGTVTPYGFAVLKGQNTELLQKFNAGLKNIKANGKYDEIIAKYVTAE